MKRRLPVSPSRKRVSIQSDEIRFNNAFQAYQQGDHAGALRMANSLLRRPAIAGSAHLLSGVIQYLQADYEAAEISLREAVRRLAAAEAWLNLALVLAARHKNQEAEAAYRKTLAIDPSQAKAWNNLGNLLVHGHDMERLQQAVDCYRQALQLNPRYASAHTNLGLAYESLKDLKQAEHHYREALIIEPNFSPALTNLGSLLESGASPEQALSFYRTAWQLAPDDLKHMGSLIALRRRLADWTAEGPHPADLITAIEQDGCAAIAPLSLLAWPEAHPGILRETARRFAQTRWASALQQPPLVTHISSRSGRRIRIGYLSADFRNHPVTHLISDVVAHHDRQKFEVFLYAYGPSIEDEARRTLRQAAEHFVDIAQVSDAAAADRIKNDGIDVLVDLTGYTTHSRLGVTALRPAPVIASWLGYVGSLGEPRLADYIIGDAIATPPEHADDFSESLALMPHCYQPNQALSPLPPSPTRASESLPDDAFVFCSFNQSFKLTPDLWDDWCHILSAVDNSVLWLAPMKEAARANLREETRERGISPDRLIFSARCPLPEHRARIGLADLALDTFPYNSGTTASDVLRAGVPMVTLMDRRFVGRMAASLLHSVGMDALITSDRRAYVELAISLAKDASRLQAIRAAIQDTLRTSRLFDPATFSRDLEKLFEAMLAQRERGERGVVTVDGPVMSDIVRIDPFT